MHLFTKNVWSLTVIFIQAKLFFRLLHVKINAHDSKEILTSIAMITLVCLHFLTYRKGHTRIQLRPITPQKRVFWYPPEGASGSGSSVAE